MGIGHAAVALGASRVTPRVNVGLLIFAAFFADFLLGIFGALGLEQAHVPPDYSARHYLTFTFPYSHGLLPLSIWAVLLGLLLCWSDRGNHARAFWVIAALVLSHFFLDGIVHVRGLPLLGESSPKFGLGLWRHLPLELSIETLMAIAGVCIYWALPGNSPLRRVGITAYALLLTILTWTQLFASTPPTNSQLVRTWMVAPLVFSLVPYLLDRKRTATHSA